MENKINVVELLKDCPQGMELDCAMYNNCTFDGIDDIGYNEILVKTPSGQIRLTKEGCFTHNDKYAKCVIFPKGKTTWEGFQRPFKDGDVVVAEDDEYFQLFLLKDLTHSEDYSSYNGYCYFGWNFQCNKLFEKGKWRFNRLATEKEKEKLFKAIKDNGYKWNSETKTLDKLIEPKFKVGDKIKHKVNKTSPFTITEITDTSYKGGYRYEVLIEQQDNFELVPDKFDITTLNPFDKVLVRDNDRQEWSISLFSHYDGLKNYKYSCLNGNGYAQCIPYEENKHLLGTTDDCDNFYKTW